MKFGGWALVPVGAGLLWWIGQSGTGTPETPAGASVEGYSRISGDRQTPGRRENNVASIPRPLPFPSVKTPDPVMETTARLGAPDGGVEEDVGIGGLWGACRWG